MKNYTDYVRELRQTFRQGAKIAPDAQGSVFETLGECPPKKSAPLNVLIFAPHPDDECIVGLLPLRLMSECGAKITDIAVTLGSKISRRAERREELESACQYLDWNLHICGENSQGLDAVRPNTRAEEPARWRKYVDEIAKILEENSPDAIFAPNPNDWNATHIGTSLLVSDAVEKSGYSQFVFQTEFWGGLKTGNLMVEASPEHIAAQMRALSLHVKEVERNDYHLRLPAWMCDNVRRGAELVGGQGAAAPHFDFATLYNAVRFDGKKWEQAYGAKFLPLTSRADSIFSCGAAE